MLLKLIQIVLIYGKLSNFLYGVPSIDRSYVLSNRFSLGQVMENLGDYTASAECLAKSLQLEPTCPILPFTTISLVFE